MIESGLAKDILERAKRDQELRLDRSTFARDDVFHELMAALDTENTAYMKQVVIEYGWPTVSLVGEEASHAAWLLIQHADLDPEFQRKCLLLMQRAPKDEVKQANIAFLVDRLCVTDNKPQEYGTQFHKLKPDDAEWSAFPIRDQGHVDDRRRQMGMQTFQENYDEINEDHNYGTKASSL
jgi:hypothetical protein